MNPGLIGPGDWNSLASLLITLWLFAVVSVIFTVNLLIGHAIIPSLGYTDQLPRWGPLARPLFYLVALLALGAAVFLALRLGNQLGILNLIYPRSLI